MSETRKIVYVQSVMFEEDLNRLKAKANTGETQKAVSMAIEYYLNNTPDEK